MNGDPPRPITDAEIGTFQRDGVVCLRGMFDGDWVERTCAALDHIIANPTEEGALLNPKGSPGRFELDWLLFLVNDDLMALATESPIGAIAAACMRSERITLLADMMLTKEPHTPTPTTWHHDQPYNWVDGSQACGMWISLDHATLESGACEWIRGSHKWGKWYAPQDLGGDSLYDAGSDLEPMPDIEADRQSYDIVHFETEPGDCIVNHMLTIHSSPGNMTDRRRRAIIYRLAGDDTVYADRGPGITKMVKPKYDPKLKHGDPFPPDHHEFLQIWPRRARSNEKSAAE